MPSIPRFRALVSCLFLLTALRAAVTSPREHFGFAIGDDFQLASYTETEAYFKKLAAESDRVKLVDIGPTEEGRRQYMVIVSSPQNLARLDHYREIARRLARAEDLTDEQARALATEGRAVVWIDGGLHATETLGTHQLIESIWTFASHSDPETMRILDQVIILFAHANPDGQELVSSWYMRRPEPTSRVVDQLPRLYEKYAGHDNNRDFMMQNLKETTNMARQFFLEWFPQIIYNHHQYGPAGTIVAGPPYRDPFNYVYDPLLVTQLDAIGAAMHSRWIAEGKGGATMKRGSVFSTWWNGGLRTTVYFHNMIGLLTETVGSPTPLQIPLVPERQVPSGDLPLPIAPQTWHYRQSIEYSLTANYAVLDYAARQRDQLLYNSYRMGRNSIDRGSRDSWTLLPSRVAAMRETYAKDHGKAARSDPAENHAIPAEYYEACLQKPELRDPRGYVIPANQPDFPTAVKFINTLIKSGVAVQRATAPFTVANRHYPAGSYVVNTAQAFRPYILDAFEPQDHPNDFQYPGGPPVAPYDSAGWTLAFQMGVQFDRVLDAFDGPFERLPYGVLQSPPAGRVESGAAGWIVSHQANNSFVLVNRLLKAGAEAYWLESPPPGHPDFGPGALYIPSSAKAAPIVAQCATELGLDAAAASSRPVGPWRKLTSKRIALWDRYGGSIPSGWTRWLFEQFEFPFEVVYSPQIDAGNLRARFDVIVFVTGAIPPLRTENPGADETVDAASRPPKPEDTPEQYRAWLGKITAEKSIPRLKQFLEEGGTIVTLGSSTNLAFHLDLPVCSALTERGADGKETALPREHYYVPGSILQAKVDVAAPLGWGMNPTADLYFDNSPVFSLNPEATARGIKPVVWFPHDHPLRSGWAWGQAHLGHGIVALAAPFASGQVFLIGPDVTFRAQSHGTFKLLFNSLYLEPVKRPD